MFNLLCSSSNCRYTVLLHLWSLFSPDMISVLLKCFKISNIPMHIFVFVKSELYKVKGVSCYHDQVCYWLLCVHTLERLLITAKLFCLLLVEKGKWYTHPIYALLLGFFIQLMFGGLNCSLVDPLFNSNRLVKLSGKYEINCLLLETVWQFNTVIF